MLLTNSYMPSSMQYNHCSPLNSSSGSKRTEPRTNQNFTDATTLDVKKSIPIVAVMLRP